ncbi:MAG: hypothetical protein ACERJ1_13055 [Halodesulfovibrio sp.]|uniref:hypothetical protein n=1 Tax=Halodesulfovibrio sp. TaxID=1912772 RepID=UPI00359D5EDE
MMSTHDLSVEVYAGAPALDFDKQFAGAKKRIFLHAAIYNRFAENAAVSNALESALACPDVTLQAVLLPVWSDIVWMDAACQLVRPEGSRDDMLKKAEVSREFFLRLAKKYPQQVTIYEGKSFPAFPLVIVDETIFCGHYAHSQVLAPEGLWMQLAVPTELLRHLADSKAHCFEYDAHCEHQLSTQQLSKKKEMSPHERAVFRYIQEWKEAKGAVITS